MDDKEKEGGGGWGISTEVEIFLAIVVVVLFIIFSGALSHLSWLTTPIVHFFTGNNSSFASGTKSVIGLLVGLSIPLSLMLFIGIVVSIERLKRIRRKEHEIFNSRVEEAYIVPPVASSAVPGVPGLSATPAPTPNLGNISRWRKILAMVDSQNQNDWRQAIIESDIILDEILTKMSYHGDGIGEKLKGATKADFRTLDQAWEAHKIRNNIAHEGSTFLISQHEAKRVVNLYKQIFEEFFYI